MRAMLKHLWATSRLFRVAVIGLGGAVALGVLLPPSPAPPAPGPVADVVDQLSQVPIPAAVANAADGMIDPAKEAGKAVLNTTKDGANAASDVTPTARDTFEDGVGFLGDMFRMARAQIAPPPPAKKTTP